MYSHGGGISSFGNATGRGGSGKRDQIELIRTKNKALASLNKQKLPDFLAKLEDLKGVVKRNINYSLTNRLRGIWTSYIRDQKLKRKPVDENRLT